MRTLFAVLFFLTSTSLFAAMGYLGRYPFTETVAADVDDFNGGAPPPPAPGRRAQYSYMAAPLAGPTAGNIVKDTPPPAKDDDFDDFEDEEFEDDFAFEEGADDPFLEDDMFEDDTTGDYADWDDL